MRSRFLPTIIICSLITIVTWLWSSPAWASIPVQLEDLDYKNCSGTLSKGVITSGSSMSANCFIITGKAKNVSGKTVYDADVYGRIYDANNNNVMQNRTRLGAIDEVPPGTTDFELRISVPANLPTPLKLKQFKSSGFSHKVRWQIIEEFEGF
ncbi:MAG: FxLYD domain-containing protein [Microcoleaceae cyanobacterium MO_207.B10]|nr:FxLYD domain-containing protein [Microcoleaceae cyanobacterium MO_207.B10]